MSAAERILTAAEPLLYREGFHATGVDRLVAAAGVTPRTLYRHFRSKDELVRAVLARRAAHYLERLAAADTTRHGDPVLACFDAHGDWLIAGGDLGCMMLKALGEYASREPATAALVRAHKRDVLALLRERVATAGLYAAAGLPEQLMLLLEGATALAPVLGAPAATAQARAAATSLLRVGRWEAGR